MPSIALSSFTPVSLFTVRIAITNCFLCVHTEGGRENGLKIIDSQQSLNSQQLFGMVSASGDKKKWSHLPAKALTEEK